ncbi:hypothetical protein MMC25_004673 [Agyrium rufum]|nr:hypothetical protein [Agyrium rufum]
MATKAHCIYCFETLAASFEHRKALSLREVESLWDEYIEETKPAGSKGNDSEGATNGAVIDGEVDNEAASISSDEDDEAAPTSEPLSPPSQPKDPSIARVQALPPASGSSSNSSTPSGLSSNASSSTALSEASTTDNSNGANGKGKPSQAKPARSGIFSFASSLPNKKQKMAEAYPLFVTWNTVTSRGARNLRGCIGTFEAQDLAEGLKSYALTSAFDDIRFPPIPSTLLSSLSVQLTLLTNFTDCADPLDWTLSTHGLRIQFYHHGKRYGATYLPDVAPEQGWTKEETLGSLMRKAGWSGRGKSEGDWRSLGKGLGLKVVRYEGMREMLDFAEFEGWRRWVEGRRGS